MEHKFWPAWDSIGDRIHEGFKSYLALRHLKKELKDIVFGYGPLEDLLRLPNVSEIMVVDKQHIYIERSGVLAELRPPVHFRRRDRSRSSSGSWPTSAGASTARSRWWMPACPTAAA